MHQALAVLLLLAPMAWAQCVLQGGAAVVATAANAAAFPRGCAVITGNVDVTCSGL